MRKLFGTLALMLGMCAAPRPAFAQSHPPIHSVAFSDKAGHTLDSLAIAALDAGTEAGMCVTSYAITNDTLVFARFTPAKYEKTDSLSIYAETPFLCPWGVPPIHVHLNGNTSPSTADRFSQLMTRTWGAILVVRPDSSWGISIY